MKNHQNNPELRLSENEKEDTEPTEDDKRFEIEEIEIEELAIDGICGVY